ncbi:MAG: AMP-binding protein, partial [Fimbriimonadaceae bacterium]|nr:AMP-binding protein [Alphaproteobacteria bacterium]
MNFEKQKPSAAIKSGKMFSTANSFAVTDIRRHDDEDGSVIIENALPLPSPLPDILERFDHWAQENADGELISEPAGSERRTLTYGDAAKASLAIADLLVSKGLEPGDVVCVIAGAGCDHALIKLACLRARLVHAPLSPVHTNSESGRSRLSDMLDVCKPALILTAEKNQELIGELQQRAGIVSAPGKFVASAKPSHEPSYSLRQRMASTEPQDVAAIYFTSGSTGDAKGVIITRLMISAVQGAIACHWPFFSFHRPVIVDWLPWHHVFGGLDNFFKMIWNGGVYHLRPAPSRDSINEAAQFMASVRPTLYVDVPFGIKLLLDQLENSEAIRSAFFSRLELIFFAGAGMDSETWSRLNRLIEHSRDIIQPSLRIASGYGSTEAASTICLAHEEPGSPGEIGVPLPGHVLRLVDVEGRTEIRVKGPNVSPGYISADGPIPMPLDEKG